VGQTQTVLSTTTSTFLGNMTASISSTSGANSSIVLYAPGNAGRKDGPCWSCLIAAALVALRV
jgi:hypothetical protein